MPFPPPPPPPGPPPSMFGSGDVQKSHGAADGRNMLLQSIRQGTTLKKTVTRDRSAPAVQGKSVGNGNNNVSIPSRNNNNNNTSSPRCNGLGDLFAGGVPKLKQTNRTLGGSNSSISSTGERKFPVPNHTQNYHEKRSLPPEIKNRGPPPQPPPANQKPSMPSSVSDSILTGPGRGMGYSNHIDAKGGAPSITKPPVNYGKPNVAPKPPGMTTLARPSPTSKKLSVNGRAPVTRAQSMRVPRSPPVAPPNGPPFPPATKELGNYKAGPGVPSFHQSQDSLHYYRTNPPPPPRTATLPSNLNQHGTAKPAAPPPPGRPAPPLRPPVARPPPPPSKLSNAVVSPPVCPPPPPPISAPPPPPPPMRTSPATPVLHNRFAPVVPCTAPPPPPPPVRHSSVRNGSTPGDVEAKFSDRFHPVIDFPSPQPFLGITKIYSSQAKGNKQQAPAPPSTHVQLASKMWANDTSSC